MRLVAREPIERPDYYALYLSSAVTLAHFGQIFTLPIYIGREHFTVDFANGQAILAAKFAARAFLFIQAAIILLFISRDAAVDINDGHVKFPFKIRAAHIFHG